MESEHPSPTVRRMEPTGGPSAPPPTTRSSHGGGLRKTTLNLVIDALMLAASLLSFASGLVLLLRFHVGGGAFATEAMGLSRLWWLNLHRLPAVVVLATAAMHIALHWKPLFARTTKAMKTCRHPGADRVMYWAFPVVAAAGFVAWFMDGSSPMAGPAVLGYPSHARHAWIDVHNVAGVVALPVTLHHTLHRWNWMVRTARGLFTRPQCA